MKKSLQFDPKSILEHASQWWDTQSFSGGRWLRYPDYQMLFRNVNYKSNLIGESHEGRGIQQYTIGKGSRPIIAWSQMHGNEATATYAIHDLLLYLQMYTSQDWYQQVFDRIHIHLIPMVNPDGAERWSRRTALDIDTNRDAVALQAKETRLLMERIKASGAELALNLHDQRNIFHLQDSNDSAVISFLAPSSDPKRGVNATRRKAMNWISHFQKSLKDVHPQGAGKYTDEFYPTAFGENVQKLGIPTVLIESGAWPNDPDRLLARKLNFYLLLDAILTLSDSHELDQHTILQYDAIPLNDNKQWDVLIKNVTIGKDKQAMVDIGIQYKYYPDPNSNQLEYKAIIGDVGDLNHHCGLQTIDAKGASFEKGNRLPHLDDAASFQIADESGYLLVLENGNLV